MKLKYFALFATAAIFIAIVFISCNSDTTVLPSSGDTLRYVGRAVCAECHSEINTEYSDQAHGQDFLTAHGQDLILGRNGACAACHTTGFNETSGYLKDGSTVYLQGISCEECHGKGSMHAANPSEKNIERLPKAEETCWVCHVPSYLGTEMDYKIDIHDLGIADVNDLTLKGKNPSAIAVHHPQALMLNGLYGFNRTNQPGPHTVVENTCVTCHLFSEEADKHGAESLEVDLESCVPCHRTTIRAQSKIDALHEEITGLLIQLGGEDPENPGHPDEDGSGGLMGAFATANGIALTSNDNPDDSAVKAYKAARHNWDFVLVDASSGVHNPGFAADLLEDAIEWLSE